MKYTFAFVLLVGFIFFFFGCGNDCEYIGEPKHDAFGFMLVNAAGDTIMKDSIFVQDALNLSYKDGKPVYIRSYYANEGLIVIMPNQVKQVEILLHSNEQQHTLSFDQNVSDAACVTGLSSTFAGNVKLDGSTEGVSEAGSYYVLTLP